MPAPPKPSVFGQMHMACQRSDGHKCKKPRAVFLGLRLVARWTNQQSLPVASARVIIALPANSHSERGLITTKPALPTLIYEFLFYPFRQHRKWVAVLNTGLGHNAYAGTGYPTVHRVWLNLFCASANDLREERDPDLRIMISMKRSQSGRMTEVHCK